MKECGSDFTNTFRALAFVSREEQFRVTDEQALDLLVANSAPVEFLEKQRKPKYPPAAILKIK
jgi:hypothetical protein